MCKLHGVRCIKGMKIFESMLKIQDLYIVTFNNTAKRKTRYTTIID